jgi:hypothetical protein
MLIEREIAARRERAQGAVARILARPGGDVYGDYQVRSSSNKTYRVAMRGPGLFDNYCSCPDFAVNTLGTCKHIEALLFVLHHHLEEERLNAFSTVVRMHFDKFNFEKGSAVCSQCDRRGLRTEDAGLAPHG